MKYLLLLFTGCTPATFFTAAKPATVYDPPPMNYAVTIEMQSKEYLAFFERFKAMGYSDGRAEAEAKRMEKLR